MWQTSWRQQIWQEITESWDIVIIGGGITGAGILREATRAGLKVLLVEKHDFAYGTSSRSSKLVHGGLRYLKHGQIRVTYDSVRERTHLRAAAPGLVTPIGFLVTTAKGDWLQKRVLGTGLIIYDLLAKQWHHRFYKSKETRLFAPHLQEKTMAGAYHYTDAQTDDARLVLRILREGVAAGGTAVNYVAATQLIHQEGQVVGVQLQDEVTGQVADVYAKVVINATGAWADSLRQQVGRKAKLRPLRGSHLVFPQWRLPVAQAISFPHPQDSRPVMVYPWEGVTLVGTTDVDHPAPLTTEPRIAPAEVAYLMTAVTTAFPSLDLDLSDIISAYAGVRPVVDSGKANPSQESREHVVWAESGLLTVTGGKLTTFRLIAHDALAALQERLPTMTPLHKKMPIFNKVAPSIQQKKLRTDIRQRLIGRYGVEATAVVAAAQAGELETIPHTKTVWAELRWGARAEGVVHLDDLLLRRVRLGIQLPQGGVEYHDKIKAICQPELGWDEAKWANEWQAYEQRWQHAYSLPAPELIPNWRIHNIPITAIIPAKKETQSVWASLAATVTATTISLIETLFWFKRA